ncbi:MAG: endonuclease/exonuclease/phosphatase family protein [Pseudomonadota bacterium]
MLRNNPNRSNAPSNALTQDDARFRIVAWNIRAGGGKRIESIAEHLRRWNADVIVLSEYRGTPASRWLSEHLFQHDYPHQITTTNHRQPAKNALLLASRVPCRRRHFHTRPDDRERWMCVTIDSPTSPLTIGAMHVPNMVTGRKYDFLAAVAKLAARWRHGPAIFVGDTNSGKPDIDEENPAFTPREADWIDELERRGWRDTFRHLNPNTREYTWYSPNGDNGFRIDQAFANRAAIDRLVDTSHVWAGPSRRAGVSDHAALIVEFRPASHNHHAQSPH